MVLAGVNVPIDTGLMFQQLALVVVLPLLAGVLTRYLILRVFEQEAHQKLQPNLLPISSLGMYGIVLIAVGVQAHNMLFVRY